MPALHTQSAFSFNGALWTIQDLVKAQKTRGNTAVLADRNLHAAYAFYHAAKGHNMRVVLGLEIVLKWQETQVVCLCFARGQEGYKSLLKLASIHAHNAPLDIDQLEVFNTHLSVVVVPYRLDAPTLSNDQWSVFAHTVNESMSYLYLPEELSHISPSYGHIPVKACYYETPEDAVYSQHLSALFNEAPVAHAALTECADETLESFYQEHALTLNLNQARLPKHPNLLNQDSNAYLKALAEKGLKRRLDIAQKPAKVYLERLQTELQTIQRLGFSDYFLFVWDLMKEAKKENILVGPGRGSAPGSLVSFALGITHVDPLEHGLLFERFLNEARQSLPDIDCDFPDDKREHLLQYTARTYGEEHVALLSTFGTFLKKSALRESARHLKIETRTLTEMLQYAEQYTSVTQMVESDKDVRNRMERNQQIQTWLSFAARIEGLPKHVSTHAAGVIVSSEPLVHYTALAPGLYGLHQTQSSQSVCEAQGLLKIDFLGLRNLTMIQTVLNQINEQQKRPLDLYRIPLDDAKTFELLREGSTTGLFQLESEGMRRLVKHIQMTSFEDIVSVLALYRPGPMESIPSFLKRRAGKESVPSIEPTVDRILKPTYGLLLYQEQIMQIATDFAGYTLVEADLLRRAVSKKDKDTLTAERQTFVSRAIKHKQSEELAQNIYHYIVRFADYGFNRSHSVAYATIAYWMAYLKAHYPAAFIGVLMQQALHQDNTLKLYMQEAHQLNLTVLGPHIQESGLVFERVAYTLRYPLIGIKGLGQETVKQYLLKRQTDGPFTDYMTFVNAVQSILSQRQLVALIHSGACDDLGLNHRTMIENLEAAYQYLKYKETLVLDEFVLEPHEEYTLTELQQFEKDVLGWNFTYHPLKFYQKYLNHPDVFTPDGLYETQEGQTLTMLGLISKTSLIKTKQGEDMAFLQCEGFFQTIEAVCFPSVYQTLPQPPQHGDVFLMKGQWDISRKKRQFRIDKWQKMLP